MSDRYVVIAHPETGELVARRDNSASSGHGLNVGRADAAALSFAKRLDRKVNETPAYSYIDATSKEDAVAKVMEAGGLRPKERSDGAALG